MSLYQSLAWSLRILAGFQGNIVHVFAKSFENLILEQKISYFNISHFPWLQN